MKNENPHVKIIVASGGYLEPERYTAAPAAASGQDSRKNSNSRIRKAKLVSLGEVMISSLGVTLTHETTDLEGTLSGGGKLTGKASHPNSP
jgi:hypothetical protein